MAEKANIYSLEDIRKIDPDLSVLSLVDENIARKSWTLVFAKNETSVSLLTTNDFPQLFHQVEDKLLAQEYDVEVFFTDTQSFAEAMKRYDLLFKRNSDKKKAEDTLMNSRAAEAVSYIKKIVKEHDTYTEAEFIDQILALSFQSGASDVHFQSEEAWVVMRLRRDGLLETVVVFTQAEWKKYLMKIKYISWAKMNQDTTSQDGRFDIKLEQTWEDIQVDVRVSILPGLRWESIVLRFLDARRGLMTFEDIGFGEYHEELLRNQLDRHSGLILVTWPTWSWKTTTVYSMINYLNSPDVKIITLEDPVEYELPGIEQSQIDKQEWYTFEEGLKWVLRHDPDVIMVWEIRTLESAEMAISAALTWHLVISTLHTNSAIESVARLINMWVKPYMLATALNAVIGQRLVRKLATKEEYEVSKADDQYLKKIIKEISSTHKDIDIEYDWILLRPEWGERSKTKGYIWRTAVIEVLDVDDEVTQAIMEGKNSFDIQELAQKRWYLNIEHNAILKVLEGVTSLTEVRRHISD